MSKLFTTLLAGAVTALAASAAPVTPAPLGTMPVREPMMKPALLNSAPVAAPVRLQDTERLARRQFEARGGILPAAVRQNEGEATTKDFVVYFNDGYDPLNEGVTVVINGDAIVFEGLASGYNVQGTYDATTGTATIPTGVVIGTHSSYGDITLMAIDGSNVTSDDIEIVFGTDGFTCSKGIAGQVAAGTLIVLNNPTGTEANGSMSMTQGTNVFTVPLVITKENNAEIKVSGISNLLYGADIPVDFVINREASTVTLPWRTQVDNQYKSTGYVAWYLGGLTDGITSLTLNATVSEEGTTTMTADAAFYGYQTTTSYSGYQFTNVVFTADFDVLAEIPEPCPIAGNNYVVFYNDDYDDLNTGMTVTQKEDGTVVLKGLLGNYEINGQYDAAASAIVVPTGMVIGTHSSYGDITLYTLEGNYLSTEPVTITIDGDQLSFGNALIGQVEAGSLYYLNAISATKANASMSVTQNGNVFTVPLVVTKTTANQLMVEGISNLLYGYYCQVPFTLDTDAATATLTFGTMVDNQYKSTGYVAWTMGGQAGSGIGDLVLNITATETTSAMSADALYYVYNTGTGYNGYLFSNAVFSVDYNVITAEATGNPVIPNDPVIDGINYLVDFEAHTATVTGCAESLTNLDIPEIITYLDEEYTVTAVAESAFQNNKTITEVTLPVTIANVGKDAFRNAVNVKTVNIPDLAAWCAISFTNGLANPIYNVFPTTQSKWGSVKVDGQAVTTLDIPEGVTYIGASFYGFKALTAVTLPSTLTEMGNQCFSNCINLTAIEIPEGVTSMGSAFFSCSSLASVTLPSTLTALTSSTFYGCSELAAIELPEALTTIGAMAFSGCTGLTTVEIPENVTSLGAMAFDGCAGLTSLASKATEPPLCGTYCFDGINKEIPLYVPAESIDAYKEADQWKEFLNISAGSSALEVIEAATAGTDATFYTLSGQRVNGTPATGIYIRVIGSDVKKVIVR